MKKFFAFLVLTIVTVSLACNTLIPTSTPTLAPPTSIAPPAECIEFNLTPEECANAGTHEYTTSTQVLFDQTGQTCLIDDQDFTISITFLTADTFIYSDAFGLEVEFSKKDHNIYTGGYVQPDGDFEWKSSITFTGDGFTHEANSYHVEGNQHLCTFVFEQKIK